MAHAGSSKLSQITVSVLKVTWPVFKLISPMPVKGSGVYVKSKTTISKRHDFLYPINSPNTSTPALMVSSMKTVMTSLTSNQSIGLVLMARSSKGLTIPSSRSGYGLNISSSTSNIMPPFNSTLTITAETSIAA